MECQEQFCAACSTVAPASGSAGSLERTGGGVAPSRISPGEPSAHTTPRLAPVRWAKSVRRDLVLLGAFLLTGVVVLYQLVVTLLHPLWLGAVTDWLRAVLAWPELVVVVVVSWRLTRLQSREARCWWMLSVAFVSYTIARTSWSIDDRFIHPNHVPFPTLPDLFFLLQYPFFFLALLLVPGGVPPWGRRARVMLDCLLLIGAASALSWYFLLAPVYLASGEPLLGKLVNLAYPLWDLCLLFGLTVALVYRRSSLDRAVLALLIIAVLCLVIADSLAAVVILVPQHCYATGHPSDLFWMAFYLLVPVTGLVTPRLKQRKLPHSTETPTKAPTRKPSQYTDLKEAFRFLAPFGAALLASAVLGLRALINQVQHPSPLAPSLVIFGLLLLALARQGVTLLENAQLRRERVEARAHELAAQAREERVREVNHQMEAFLGIATHELKTPLTSILMGVQVMQRRLQRQVSNQTSTGEGRDRAFVICLSTLEVMLQQLGRLNRLVNDLVDISRIQHGRLEFQFALTDLAALVDRSVEEQRQAAPERTILLECLSGGAVPVVADAERLGQVVTNYLTNALKYSHEAAPVEVGMQVEGQQGRVWVRDQGPGIAPAEQELIWERFHRVPGMEVQSGSGIGLGLGLHISKTIIERHLGQVGVESSPGQGAMFWFTLPLAHPGEEAPGWADETLHPAPCAPDRETTDRTSESLYCDAAR